MITTNKNKIKRSWEVEFRKNGELMTATISAPTKEAAEYHVMAMNDISERAVVSATELGKVKNNSQ